MPFAAHDGARRRTADGAPARPAASPAASRRAPGGTARPLARERSRVPNRVRGAVQAGAGRLADDLRRARAGSRSGSGWARSAAAVRTPAGSGPRSGTAAPSRASCRRSRAAAPPRAPPGLCRLREWGTSPSSIPTRNTESNSSPLAECSVMRTTGASSLSLVRVGQQRDAVEEPGQRRRALARPRSRRPRTAARPGSPAGPGSPACPPAPAPPSSRSAPAPLDQRAHAQPRRRFGPQRRDQLAEARRGWVARAGSSGPRRRRAERLPERDAALGRRASRAPPACGADAARGHVQHAPQRQVVAGFWTRRR